MSGDRQTGVDGSARRQRSANRGPGWTGADWPQRARGGSGANGRQGASGARRGLVIFALGLIMALGAVLTLIAAGSVQALPHASALHAKADGWVGLAATISVLVSAAAGVLLVQRYVNARRRRR